MHRTKKDIEQDPRAIETIKELGPTHSASQLANILHTTDAIIRVVAKANDVRLKPGKKGKTKTDYSDKKQPSTPARQFLTMRLR